MKPKTFILQQEVYMTEDLYAPEGIQVSLSPYVDDRLLHANQKKGWTPVVITHATSLWTGEQEELDIQTHWIKSTDLKEVTYHESI